jgi:hypothetical protein
MADHVSAGVAEDGGHFFSNASADVGVGDCR